MSEINDQHSKKLEHEIQLKYKYKKNINTMQTFVDRVEKERNNEKNLRLKLEEEYMHVQRNHEEEVNLRLEFEAKLNEVNKIVQEQEIAASRVTTELKNYKNECKDLQRLAREQSDELIVHRSRYLEFTNKIDEHVEYKKSS